MSFLEVAEEALALLFRFAVGARFRWKFDRELSFFAARKKAHKRIMQYAPDENVLFKVRACAAAPSTK